MKKLFIILLMPLLGLAQPTNGFVIKGNISGIKDNTEVILMSGNDGKTITSDKAVKGVFTLTGKLNEPDVFLIRVAGTNELIDLYMHNDAVTVSGSLADMKNIKVKGSSLQDDFMMYKERVNPFIDKVKMYAAIINPEKNMKKRDSLIGEYTIYQARAVEAAGKFFQEKKASPVSSFVLFRVAPLLRGIDDIAARYDLLQPAAKTGSFARLIEKNIADSRVGGVGTQALEFTQKDVDGKPVSLSSFRGKYVLVDFWASWCRPCRAENPNVVSAYQTYKNKNFTVLGVSLDQSKPSWVEAIKADGLAWTHVSDLQYWNNAVAQLYHIGSIPANMLIDPTGKIIAKDLRGEDLNRKLKELLK